MRSNLRVLLSALATALFASLVGGARAADAPPAAPLREQLTPEEFAQMGLQKLSPEELSRLQDWIAQRKHIEVEKTRVVVREQAVADTRKKAEEQGVHVFEVATEREFSTRIAGTFRGFAGRGMKITLQNGQVWRLLDDRIERANLESPKVTLRQSVMGNHYLFVDGMSSARVSVVREK